MTTQVSSSCLSVYPLVIHRWFKVRPELQAWDSSTFGQNSAKEGPWETPRLEPPTLVRNGLASAIHLCQTGDFLTQLTGCQPRPSGLGGVVFVSPLSPQPLGEGVLSETPQADAGNWSRMANWEEGFLLS